MTQSRREWHLPRLRSEPALAASAEAVRGLAPPRRHLLDQGQNGGPCLETGTAISATAATAEDLEARAVRLVEDKVVVAKQSISPGVDLSKAVSLAARGGCISNCPCLFRTPRYSTAPSALIA